LLGAGGLWGCGLLVGIQDTHPLDAGCDSGLDDPDNCGACGHSCLGGQCVSGQCAPVELARNESFPTAIAVEPGDAGNVYWANDRVQDAPNGAIRRIDKSGSPDTMDTVYATLPSEYSLTGLALDDANVYFTVQDNRDFVGGNVSRIGKDKTGHASVGPYQGPGPIAIDGTFVFWANRTSGDRIERAGLDLSSPTVLFTTTAFVGDAVNVVVEPGATGRVFWADGGLNRMNKDGTNHVVLEPTAIESVALDDTTVYFFGQQNAANHASVLSMGKDGTCPASATSCPQVLATDFFPGNMVVDATTIYFTTIGDGQVMAVGKDGSNLRQLASGLLMAAGVAVDDVAVYVSDQFGGRVLKIAK
jgi:hypothetical protein